MHKCRTKTTVPHSHTHRPNFSAAFPLIGTAEGTVLGASRCATKVPPPASVEGVEA